MAKGNIDHSTPHQRGKHRSLKLNDRCWPYPLPCSSKEERMAMAKGNIDHSIPHQSGEASITQVE